ncbi:MAG: aspartyl protease family protein [bacterium]
MKEDLILKTRVRVANPIDISRYEEIDVVIDTGAAFSVIKKDRLKRIGISIIGKKRLKLANGKVMERDYGIACFALNGKGVGGSDVIFGEEEDVELLGLLTIEGMALSVDTTTGELKPIELFLV